MNLRHNMSVTQSVRRWLLAVPLTLSFWLASAQTYSFGQTLALTTDKACYQSGSTVTFTASETIPASDTATILTEMAYLNRLHINGVQFYDWQWKHHELLSLPGDGSLDPWYQDISYRWARRCAHQKVYRGAASVWHEVDVLQPLLRVLWSFRKAVGPNTSRFRA